jgi:hypothetical protein
VPLKCFLNATQSTVMSIGREEIPRSSFKNGQ